MRRSLYEISYNCTCKGKLANHAVDLFEKIGVTCDEIKDKDTRKLIFTNEELKIKFFLSKPSDVPTYVEYGAADIGIVGKDTILEENRKLFEVLDLGLQVKCRMCVCGPESAAEKLKNHGAYRRWQQSIRTLQKTIFLMKRDRLLRLSNLMVQLNLLLL